LRGVVVDEREMSAGRYNGTIMVQCDGSGDGVYEVRVYEGRWENPGIVLASTNTPKSVIFVISSKPNLTLVAASPNWLAFGLSTY